MRIRPALVATLTVLTLGAASACSSADPAPTATDTSGETPSATTGSPSPSTSPGTAATTEPPAEDPEPAGVVLSVDVSGDEVSPNGELVELAVGETLTIEVDSDRPGELHVHSKPDQYVDFEAGTSTQEITVEVPGSIEVEDHDTGDLVAQLQVR